MASSVKIEGLPVTLNDGSLKSQEQSKGSAMTKKGVYAAVSYMASAVLLVMFNKAALSSYSFPCVNVITLFQMLCSCSILYALRCWKVISFTDVDPQSITYNPFTLVPLETLIGTLPLAIAYLLYMLITMEAVRGINVPMYTTLRRTTVAFTMIVEYLLTGQKHSLAVVGSVGTIILGAIIAGARDLSFDAYGYAVVFIANICTAIYLASIARIGKSSGLNSFGLMWCNGLICAPILLFWTSFKGDLEVTMNFPFLFYPGFQVVMLLSCIMAFSINYFVFLNTTLNSALTQTICGNLKDFFTIVLGWLLFGGLPFDLLNVIGQSLGFMGSCLYAFCKLWGI
ncbi:UDP-N-acetylglucosamine transporter UGNT1-like [Mangifera indica]|uniref:UDP-N-acetylglucosamine transporter UGNT1-like n=1 Tax=Mangifera indica TaxID=29780 RepID=UPI001CFA7EA9|nr:UDP-N-acetylglucosamine transporter UGNT1-like [Mangifera indica]